MFFKNSLVRDIRCHVGQEDLSSPDVSPDYDRVPGQPVVVVQPTSSMSVGEQVGERTALAGASVTSAYRTADYTMS